MSEFTFDSDTGIGYQSIQPRNYDDAYFHKYVAMGRSTFGVALNSLRVGLVSRYLALDQQLIDIGVGDGAFIRARGGETYGYDINPFARTILKGTGKWFDVSVVDSMESASFWDALEHIADPLEIIQKVAAYCFVSIPIFRDRHHILTSKHYRPDEHYWYFTRAGIISWFWDAGFVCQEMNGMETMLGREDIDTFVFVKRGA